VKRVERSFRLLHHRTERWIALSPQLDKAGVVLDCLLSVPATLIDLRQSEMRRTRIQKIVREGSVPWLGVVEARAREAFEIPAAYPYCGVGLNLFLVVRRTGRGYWVGPLRHQRGARVELVIEKYAGLSSARLELP
jgi:hypothetical protein